MPKPTHGWRAFFGEVGIIVLGVLIALGFEQLVTSIHENTIAEQARSTVKAEVRENLWWVARREKEEPRIQRRLDELGGLLARAGHGNSIPLVQNLGTPPHAKIMTLRWEANAQAGRASLFSDDEQRVLDNMYYTTEEFRRTQTEEEVVWSKMDFIQGLQQLAPEDVHDFSVFLAEARYRNSMVRLSIYRAHQWAQKMDLIPDNPNPVEGLKENRSQVCPPLTHP